MSEKSDRAAYLFERSFNCAQSVLAVFCDAYDTDFETAVRSAAGLGGGVRCGEICGALSGAVMAVGLRYGWADPDDDSARENCAAKTAEVVSAFRTENGAVRCRDLLGCDVSTAEGASRFQAENLRERVCVPAVRGAVELLERLGY
jgi:C_GCAxxG_C_C family probable redox protein